MPRQPVEDSDSSEDEIPAQRGNPAIPQDPLVGDRQELESEEEGGSELAEDQCIVEKILDHKFDREGVLYFHIKWEGLTNRHNTWEPEENVITASERLEEYFREIGGRPIQNPVSKKRKIARSKPQLSQKVPTELPHSLSSIDLDPSDRSEKPESLKRSGPTSPALANGSAPREAKENWKSAGSRAPKTRVSESHRLSAHVAEEEGETAGQHKRPEPILVIDSSDEHAEPPICTSVLASPSEENMISRQLMKSPSVFATLSEDDTVSERPMKRRFKHSQSSSGSGSARKKNYGRSDSETLGHAINSEEYTSDNNQLGSNDSWGEHDIESVKTIQLIEGKRIIVFLIRKDGREITVSKEDAYKKCPQQMLQFYEINLQFNEPGRSD